MLLAQSLHHGSGSDTDSSQALQAMGCWAWSLENIALFDVHPEFSPILQRRKTKAHGLENAAGLPATGFVPGFALVHSHSAAFLWGTQCS
jgi:hypothetical protein